MEKPLRILHLEDQPDDAELVRAALKREGLVCDLEVVSTREEYAAALERGGFDLILSDYSLPGFDGLSALKMALEKAGGVPFIFVSGTLGEEAAIDGVRSGATDYVLKQRLARLGPAVRRALSEAEERSRSKQLEEQLHQAQKMEAIGQLAGGVAHDFNNLLNVIIGYSDLLLAEGGPEDPRRPKLEQIRSAGLRAASLTRQLLAFSRKQVIKPKVLDLNPLVAEMEKMLRRLIGEDIQLVTRQGRDLGRIEADPGQIEQVLLNLVVNARDAMPQGGTITIETANADLDEAYALQHPLERPGPHVMLAVSDTGVGMTPEVRARIFEPFFTTKEPGKGTGLGLATVYGIVKQSGGSIGVSSEPGRGTTFKMYLPRVNAPADSAGERESAAPPRGTETILVVEDEAVVRELIVRCLEGYGYTVLTASDSGRALEASRRHAGPIHLLLTDVVMPVMSGRQVAEQLASLRPEIKILYMSGYTDDAVLRHGVLEKGVPFLQKPFALAALARKVREVLDGRPVGPS